jgi:gamma-glutamyltranspeptidase/glutathione hydrolase
MNLELAVNSPRFRHQWRPDVTYVENGISSETLALLGKMGHTIEVDPGWSDGECIAIDPTTGERLGASDFRNHGKAVGY